MKPLLLKQPLPELLEIGSVSNPGATVIAGTPNVGVASIFGEPTDNLNCGVFSCTRGSFVMEYPFAEHATVWEGSATLTNERTGESVQYQAGDSGSSRRVPRCAGTSPRIASSNTISPSSKADAVMPPRPAEGERLSLTPAQ